MEETAQKPELNEVTKPQVGHGGMLAAMNGINGLPEPPTGSYETYRNMMSHPALVLAQVTCFAPIQSAGWAFEEEDGAPSDAVDMITENLSDMRPLIIREALRAVNFGWYGAEKIFELKEGWFGLKRLKSLLPDLTTIRIDDGGNFMGLDQKRDGVSVPREKCWLYTHDQEGGNLYGRSRLENARRSKLWTDWHDAQDGAARYDRKMAGAFWILHYPPDKEIITRTGEKKEAWKVAQDCLDSICAGKPIALPNEFTAIDEYRNMDGPQKKRWILEIMEDKGGRQPTFVQRLEYIDKCMLRSYHVPERAASEATQAGSRADSGTASDIVTASAQLLHEDIVRCVNWHIVDQLLAINYGEKYRGTVYITASPIVDSTKELVKQIVESIMTQPGSVDLALSLLDFDAMLDLAGLPKASGDITDVLAGKDSPTPAPTAQDPSALPGVPGQPSVDPMAANAYDGLNGAQITAALSVLDRYAGGSIDRNQAVELLKAMQVPPEQAARIVGTGKPKKQPAPQPAQPSATRALLSLARVLGR